MKTYCSRKKDLRGLKKKPSEAKDTKEEKYQRPASWEVKKRGVISPLSLEVHRKSSSERPGGNERGGEVAYSDAMV